jgi:hypothetical protein
MKSWYYPGRRLALWFYCVWWLFQQLLLNSAIGGGVYGYTNIFDHVANTSLASSERWLEIGFMFVNLDTWTTVDTTYLAFKQPVAFLGLPTLPATSTVTGKSIALRIRNAALTSFGSFTFEAKGYNVNNSFCDNLAINYTPDQLTINSTFVSWMVAERGLFSINGRYFSVNVRENATITDANSVTNSANWMAVTAVTGCIDPAVTVRCEIRSYCW